MEFGKARHREGEEWPRGHHETRPESIMGLFSSLVWPESQFLFLRKGEHCSVDTPLPSLRRYLRFTTLSGT